MSNDELTLNTKMKTKTMNKEIKTTKIFNDVKIGRAKELAGHFAQSELLQFKFRGKWKQNIWTRWKPFYFSQCAANYHLVINDQIEIIGINYIPFGPQCKQFLLIFKQCKQFSIFHSYKPEWIEDTISEWIEDKSRILHAWIT